MREERMELKQRERERLKVLHEIRRRSLLPESSCNFMCVRLKNLNLRHTILGRGQKGFVERRGVGPVGRSKVWGFHLQDRWPLSRAQARKMNSLTAQ